MITAKTTKTKGRVWEVRFRAPDGMEVSRTFNTRRAALDFEAAQRADRARGVAVDIRNGIMPFREWAAEWAQMDSTKRVRSRQRDLQIIKLHLNPTLGAKPLGRVTPLDVQRLIKSWIEKGLASATVRRHYAVLRAILTAAVEADMIGRSPCRGVRLPLPEPKPRRELSAPELKGVADAMHERYRTLLYVGAVAGLRWSEAAALRVGRLDLLRHTLTVAEGLHEAKGGIVSEPPKSAASRRTVSIPPQLSAMLADHLTRAGLTGADIDALVFTAPDGGPLRYSNFRARVWAPAVEKANIGRLGFHDLRRAFATVMLAEGADVPTTQQMMGHADPRLTIAYATPTVNAGRAAAARVGAFFVGALPNGANHDAREKHG